MLFNSPVYIFVFLPAVIAVYFLLNRNKLTTASKLWTVAASLFFYAYWKPEYLALIVISMLVNFSLGVLLHRTRQRPTGGQWRTRHRSAILAVGVVFNLGLLGTYKYADFVIENINLLASSQIPALDLVLPLAISFFTFQQIAYLVDCYQTDTQEYQFLNYCLFVSFFPQLIAGPIVHHGQMMPQFMRLRNSVLDWRNVATGLFIFALGLFKKVVIADSLSVWANAGFNTTDPLSLYGAWITSFSYTFQLYYDFCGYSDMAIGAALLFNIRLPVNFNAPYKAGNIQDFWRRWHMTLSAWLRDYVYIPLGGNRRGGARTYLNLLVTFVLGGLWHGAGWTFVAWGAMHGIAIAVHRLWHSMRLRMPTPVGWLLTFGFVHFTWVFFRAESMSSALRVLRGMLGMNELPGTEFFAPMMTNLKTGRLFPIDPDHWFLIPIEANGIILASMVAILVLPSSVQMIGFVKYDGWLRFRPNCAIAVVTAVMFGVALIYVLMSRGSEFLYFNF